MTKSPLISVIVPTFNRAALLAECVDSILDQSARDFEIVIISDGSTDHTGEVVAAYDDPRIVFLEKENGGQGSARNLGITHSRGVYISLCDDDDLLYPDHLSILSRCLEEHKDIGLAYTDALWTYPNGSETPKVAFSQDFDKKSLENHNFITTQTVMFRKSCAAHTGLFNENPRLRNGLEDWEFLLRFSDRYPLRHIKGVTGEYRVHEGNSFQAGSGYDYCSAFFFVRTLRFNYLLAQFGPSLFDHVDHMYPFHLVQSYINSGKYTEAAGLALQLNRLYSDYTSPARENPVTELVILFSLGVCYFTLGHQDHAKDTFYSICSKPSYSRVEPEFSRFVKGYATKTPSAELKGLLLASFSQEGQGSQWISSS